MTEPNTQPDPNATPPVATPPGGAGTPPPTTTPPATAPPATTPPTPSPTELDRKVTSFLGDMSVATKPKPKTKPSTTTSPKTPEQLVEEGDTVGAIKLVAEQTRNQTVADLQDENKRRDWNTKRYDANKKVYLAHPEIMEVDSGSKPASEVPISGAMSQVYREFPWLLDAPEGPVVALDIAEKRVAGSQAPPPSTTPPASTPGAPSATAPTTPAATPPATPPVPSAQATASGVITSSGSGAPPPSPGTETPLNAGQTLVASRLGMTEADYRKFGAHTPIYNKEYYAKYKNAHNRPRGGAA